MKGGREAGEADRGFGGRRFLREGEGRADAFFQLPVSPGIAMSLGQKLCHIILLHETVSLREDGKNILIKLHAQQYNQHTEDVGEKKAT